MSSLEVATPVEDVFGILKQFFRVKGVIDVKPGYSGGKVLTQLMRKFVLEKLVMLKSFK